MIIIYSALEMILFEQEDCNCQRRYYDGMKLLDYTPLFYFYLPFLSDDVFNVISKQDPPKYDFFGIRNNNNQTLFHLLFAFSIYNIIDYIFVIRKIQYTEMVTKRLFRK